MFFQHWWTVALRGLISLAFGVGIFVWPGMTVGLLVELFGAYALADGILAVHGAVWAARWQMSWWPFLAEGAIGIAVGALDLFWLDIPLFGLLTLIAVWAVLTGVFQIVAAALVWRVMAGVWLLALSGAASVLLGALLVAFPGASVLAVVWLIAAYALGFGALLLRIALHMRPWEHHRAMEESGR